ILETQSATLTNHEVLTHITTHARLSASLSSSSSLPPSPPQPTSTPSTPPSPNSPLSTNTTTILSEVVRYLTSSAPSLSHPTSNSSPRPPHLSTAQIQELVKKLGGYGLTKAEVLMIVNLGVRELGLLDCVVEECDERLGEEEQGVLIRVVEGVVGGLGEGVE
ncbi:MAG: hypothetical protein Q9192_008853, partial [Flavoplaca navasiana]